MVLYALFVPIFLYVLSGMYRSETECIICTYFVCIVRVVGRGVDLCALFVHILSVFYVW